MANRLSRLEAEVAAAAPAAAGPAAGTPAAPARRRPVDLLRRAARGESAVQRWVRTAGRPAPAGRPAAQQSDISHDPGAGGRSIDAAALEPADVIVSTTAGRLSGAIRGVTGQPVSHAAIYVGDGLVVEAIGKGVVLRPLAEALADASLAVAFRVQGLTAEQRARVRDAAGRRVGRGYDYVGIVRQARFQRDAATHCGGLDGEALRACRADRARVNFGTAENDRFFCSELVVAAFAEAGVPLVALPPAAVTPGDLAELGAADRLGYVGHLRAAPAAQSAGRMSRAAGGPLPDLSAWGRLVAFHPPAGVAAGLAARAATVGGHRVPGTHMRVQDIDDGWGRVNLDHYPVRVTRLPTGYPSADDLLGHVRVNLTDFLHPAKATFEPYEPADGTAYGSAAPVGAVMRFNIMVGGVNLDDGSVVCAEHSPRHWVFSTVWTPRDLGHPVSGNREWGYVRPDDGGWVFYTRAADRVATAPEAVVNEQGAFAGAHALWLDFQQRLVRFVTDHGGAAAVEPATSDRYPWDDVKALYYR